MSKNKKRKKKHRERERESGLKQEKHTHNHPYRGRILNHNTPVVPASCSGMKWKQKNIPKSLAEAAQGTGRNGADSWKKMCPLRADASQCGKVSANGDPEKNACHLPNPFAAI